MSEEKTDAGRRELAREYERLSNRLFFVRMGWAAALLLIYQFSGVSAAVADGLRARFGADHWVLVNIAYTAVSVLAFSAFLFPLSFYEDFVVQRHYGLSKERFGAWLADYFKSLLIDIVIASVLFAVFYALLRAFPRGWWVAAALFYILFSVVLSLLYPVLIMPLFHKFEPLEDEELVAAVRRLMEEEGIEVVGVYKWGLSEKTTTANAAFVGMGKTRRIVLGDTLLDGYSREEILAVLAHEVGHYKHRDLWRLAVAGSALAFLGFYLVHLFLERACAALGRPVYDIATAPLFVFGLFLFSILTMPLVNLLSRRREFAADAYAARKTGDPEALARALEKLADQNLADTEPSPLMEALFHGHPSIARRTARLRKMKA